ncbi:MAG: hypothetical protein ACXVB5_11505 [Isosphaeraceae bacterium]
MTGKGAAPPETTHSPQEDPTTDQGTGPQSNSNSGDGAKEGIQTPEVAFVGHLYGLGVPLFTARPGGRIDVVPNGEGELVEHIFRGHDDPEFIRPKGWQTLTAEGNEDRIAGFRPDLDYALCMNCGEPIAVIDVDPRNGGDIEKVRALLKQLGVRIYADLNTPGGGNHFYVQGHADLLSTSSKKDGRMPDFPGVDIQSFGRNVFLPLTMRPKYQGRSYTVVFDDLMALPSDPDPEGAEALAQWVAEQRYQFVRKTAKKRKDSVDFEFERIPEWTGGSRTSASRLTSMQCWRGTPRE